MQKDHDWLDYANLASLVGQNVQLNQIQRGFQATGEQWGDIALAETDSEWRERERELEEEYCALQENTEQTGQQSLRDEIFQGGQRLKKIRTEMLSSDPRRALVVAMHSVRPPPTADLEAYEDKERAQSLQNDLAAFVHECKGRLSEADQTAAETCLKYLREQGPLARLIGYAQRKEHEAGLRAKLEVKLKDESAKLQELRQAAEFFTGREQLCRILGPIAGIALAIGGIAVEMNTTNPADPGDSAPILYGVFGFLLGLVVFVGGSIAGNEPRQKRQQEAQACADRVDQMKKRLAARPGINASWPHDVAKKFGENLDSAGYRRIFEERVPLIKEVLQIKDEIPPDLIECNIAGALALDVDGGRTRRRGHRAIDLSRLDRLRFGSRGHRPLARDVLAGEP